MIKEYDNKNSAHIRLNLCEGRHISPTENYFFSYEDTKYYSLERFEAIAEKRIQEMANSGIKTIHIYVNGFMPAMTSLFKVWQKVRTKMRLVIYHYNRATEQHDAQYF